MPATVVWLGLALLSLVAQSPGVTVPATAGSPESAMGDEWPSWAMAANGRLTSPDASSLRAHACPAQPGVPPASVGLRVLVPASVSPGETVTCRIRAYNNSPVAVYQVELRCRLDSSVELAGSEPQAEQQGSQLVWRFAQLRPGEVRAFTLRLRPSVAGPIRVCARIRYEHGVCVETTVRPEAEPPGQPILELHKEAPTQVVLDQSVAVRLVIHNRGSAPAEEVVVVDELPEGLEHADGGRRLTFFLGRIAPGQQRVVQYRLVARRPGNWTNRATVRARGGIEAFASQTITVAEPKLAVHVDAPAQAFSGTALPVRIRVTNAGAVPLNQVAVEYRIPSGSTVLESRPAGTVGTNVVRWTIQQLPPQEAVSFTVQLRPMQAGTVEHVVTAIAGTTVARARATTQVLGAAGLLLVVVDTDDPVLVGQDTRYHLIVRNQGSAAATNIRLRVQVPEEFAITRVQGPSDHQRDGQKILFEPLHLPPNTDRIYRIYVRALKPGVVRLRVEMTADQLPAGPVRAEESTTILDASGQ